jgi:hypothetical protein
MLARRFEPPVRPEQHGLQDLSQLRREKAVQHGNFTDSRRVLLSADCEKSVLTEGAKAILKEFGKRSDLSRFITQAQVLIICSL